jgi:hypothetical protein
MERHVFLFLGLLCILFFGSFLTTESFVDASGVKQDASGQYVTVSLKDLFALLSQGKVSKEVQEQMPKGSDVDMYGKLKDSIVGDVRSTVREQLQAKSDGTVLTDSCIDSVANQQGTEWMRYIPGKNPADYIRKDSIPCYACNIPT